MKAAKATSLLLTLFVALSIPCAALAQDRDDAAARERARLYTDGKSPLSATDPEFAKTSSSGRSGSAASFPKSCACL